MLVLESAVYQALSTVVERDRNEYELKITQIAVADELAAAASLLMGQAAEGRPIVIAKGFPYNLRESDLSELIGKKVKICSGKKLKYCIMNLSDK